MGIMQQNPATAKGVVEIMKVLSNYVPVDGDNNPHSILCNGDQLSVERMVEARQAMAGSRDPIHRLLGLEPSPQEFHKRCILLQVYI